MGIFKIVVLNNILLFCFIFFGYACFERKAGKERAKGNQKRKEENEGESEGKERGK